MRRPIKHPDGKPATVPADYEKVNQKVEQVFRKKCYMFFDGTIAAYKKVFFRYVIQYPWKGEECLICKGPPRGTRIVLVRAANKRNSSNYVTAIVHVKCARKDLKSDEAARNRNPEDISRQA